MHIQLQPVSADLPANTHKLAATHAGRLLAGAMTEDPIAVQIIDLTTGSAQPLDPLPVVLPAEVDFDLSDTAGGGLDITFEFYRGATVWLSHGTIGAGDATETTEPPQGRSYTRPRFLRGGEGVVVSENGEHAVLLQGEERRKLCDCMDAVGLVLPGGLAVVAKELQPGPMVGNEMAGTLSLTLPQAARSGLSEAALFEGSAIYAYDAQVDGAVIWTAAATRTGVRVLRIAADGRSETISVSGLGGGSSPLQVALVPGVDGLSLAVLVEGHSGRRSVLRGRMQE